MTTRVDIQPDLIKWAIQRAGHELDLFLSSNPKYDEWLEKKEKPTVKQLEDFAKKLSVPFGYLFLDQPPKEKLGFTLFRTGKNNVNKASIDTWDTVRIVKKRQDWLSEYLKNEGEEKLEFVGKFNLKSKVQEVVSNIRHVLGLSFNWTNSFANWENTLNHFIDKIEGIGIVTVVNGVVGNNNNRKLNVNELRGFVLVDDYAPFIFVNNNDTKAAKMFTLAHELAHIFVGESAGFDLKNILPSNDPLELFCNEVAAEFLVPSENFLTQWKSLKDNSLLSKVFKVSPLVINRRAYDLNLISKDKYFEYYNKYIEKINNLNLDVDNKKKSGGNFYNTQKRRLSPRFAFFVDTALKQNKLLYRDAYRLTGIKGKTFDKFISRLYHD